MLPDWTVWYVSLSALLECFPAIDHINVRLVYFPHEVTSVQSNPSLPLSERV
jgi:hypothetical protein